LVTRCTWPFHYWLGSWRAWRLDAEPTWRPPVRIGPAQAAAPLHPPLISIAPQRRVNRTPAAPNTGSISRPVVEVDARRSGVYQASITPEVVGQGSRAPGHSRSTVKSVLPKRTRAPAS